MGILSKNGFIKPFFIIQKMHKMPVGVGSSPTGGAREKPHQTAVFRLFGAVFLLQITHFVTHFLFYILLVLFSLQQKYMEDILKPRRGVLLISFDLVTVNAERVHYLGVSNQRLELALG